MPQSVTLFAKEMLMIWIELKADQGFIFVWIIMEINKKGKKPSNTGTPEACNMPKVRAKRAVCTKPITRPIHGNRNKKPSAFNRKADRRKAILKTTTPIVNNRINKIFNLCDFKTYLSLWWRCWLFLFFQIFKRSIFPMISILVSHFNSISSKHILEYQFLIKINIRVLIRWWIKSWIVSIICPVTI